VSGTDAGGTGFNGTIKPMFREFDRQAMLVAFDLWSYQDVSQHADAILLRLVDGTMPCDGPWSDVKIGLFRRWVDDGKPE
jgi:hypothetical protein